MTETRKECGFRQLCAIATALLGPRPAYLLESSDWKGAVQDRAHALGYKTPMTEIVWRAMDASEQAYRRKHPPKPHRQARPEPIISWAARRYVAKRSPSLPSEDDGPEWHRPLRLDPMVPLVAGMPAWLRTLLKSHASKP